MIRWIIAILLILVLEYYSFQAFRTLFKTKWAVIVELITLIAVCYIVYAFATYDRSIGQNKKSLFTIGLFLLMLLPKIFIALILIGEDLIRLIVGVFNYFSQGSDTGSHIPERRRFVSMIALGIASVPFLGLLHGIFVGKFNFRVIRQQLFFDDLPENFDGFTITQISDIHSGSFDNPEKINYAVDLINEQESDMVLFTGDIVNTRAAEMDPWIETFNRIKNPEFGKFSILGNHDYGEYIKWDTQKEKADNFIAIKALHPRIGFRLLLNEHQIINKGADRLAIVGVENWGHNFKKAGDLQRASAGLSKDDFKILLTHDPSHWEYEVKHHEKNFQLTLAGHTHGFQFGIEIPGFLKWSPVQYVYKQWAGLYEHFGRFVYVNRGLGYHAYPGRVGIWPEITVIELKKRRSAA